MSRNEEFLAGTEGEEIRTIDISTSISSQNHHDKVGNDEVKEVTSDTKEKSVKETAKRKPKEFEECNVPSSSSSNQDICRICHMGNSTSYQSCVTNEETENHDGNRVANSAASLNLGMLVSACRCRGTVGLVHTKCLERWLTESGHTRCELCGYRYATIRVPRHSILRSLLIWIRTFVATRQMLLDSMYLVVTTPLAVFSAYVCAMTLKMALENRIGDIPWTIVAMLPTCSLTLVAYWGWLLTLQRLHGRRWRQYWQNNFIVQLVPDSPIVENQSNEDLDAYQEEVYYDMPEMFNVM